jgi:hypothetical protein
MMNHTSHREKAAFAIGFLAAATAIGSFKEELQNMYINLGWWSPSLFEIGVAFVVILAIAGYLYALDLAVSGVSPHTLLSMRIRSWIIGSANFCYGLALAIPPVFIVIWCFVRVLLLLNPIAAGSSTIFLISIVASAVGAFASAGGALLFSSKKTRQVLMEEQISVAPEAELERHMVLMEDAAKSKRYADVILEAGTSVKYLMQCVLRKNNLSIAGLRCYDMAKIAAEQNLIRWSDYDLVKSIRRYGAIMANDPSMYKAASKSSGKAVKTRAARGLKDMRNLYDNYR